MREKPLPPFRWLYCTSPAQVVAFGLPQVAFLAWIGLTHGVPLSAAPGWIALGLAQWSLVEYLLHRFVLHSKPRNRVIRVLASGMHELHHEHPRDVKILNIGPLTSVPVAVAIFFGVAAALQSWGRAGFVMVGSLLGFFAYEFIHHRAHARVDVGSWFSPLHRNHAVHHFIDEGVNFGVTSPLWDKVFGTFRPARHPKKRVSAAS